jgi:hypothetical protein
MITRSRFLKVAGVGALGSVGVGAAVRAASADLPAPLTQQYQRSSAPPVSIAHPAGWNRYEQWGDEAYVNPLPLLALTNLRNGIPTLNDNPVPSPRDLTANDILLTIYAVPLDQQEQYMPGSAADAGVTALTAEASGIAGVSIFFDWLVRQQGDWGYLIYGYVGDSVPAGQPTMQAVLSSARFG